MRVNGIGSSVAGLGAKRSIREAGSSRIARLDCAKSNQAAARAYYEDAPATGCVGYKAFPGIEGAPRHRAVREAAHARRERAHPRPAVLHCRPCSKNPNPTSRRERLTRPSSSCAGSRYLRSARHSQDRGPDRRAGSLDARRRRSTSLLGHRQSPDARRVAVDRRRDVGCRHPSHARPSSRRDRELTRRLPRSTRTAARGAATDAAVWSIASLTEPTRLGDGTDLRWVLLHLRQRDRAPRGSRRRDRASCSTAHRRVTR